MLRIVPGDNEVVVGDREGLLAPGLLASRVNWLREPPGDVDEVAQERERVRFVYRTAEADTGAAGP